MSYGSDCSQLCYHLGVLNFATHWSPACPEKLMTFCSDLSLFSDSETNIFISQSEVIHRTLFEFQTPLAFFLSHIRFFLLVCVSSY